MYVRTKEERYLVHGTYIRTYVRMYVHVDGQEVKYKEPFSIL